MEDMNYAHYYWFGEVGMTSILTVMIAVPAGCWFAGQTEIPLAFIGTAFLFLPLFFSYPNLFNVR